MNSIEYINKLIRENVEQKISVKQISDTHHTFADYIEMRNELFIALCNVYQDIAWKSKKHFDEENDPMYDGDFIAGINAPDGIITFHLKKIYWDKLDVLEIERAPLYDGYTKDDVYERIRSLKK